MSGPPPLPGARGSLYVMETAQHKGKAMTMEEVFKEINKSGTGYITFKEFIGWWKWKEAAQGTKTISDDILMVSMREFNNHSGGNGTIELDELYGLVGALKLQETLLGKLDSVVDCTKFRSYLPDVVICVPARCALRLYSICATA